jgi:orotate phosphoribosyltransferase-like protein
MHEPLQGITSTQLRQLYEKALIFQSHGLSVEQITQELSLIFQLDSDLRGQLDINHKIAKILCLTNDQIEQWSAQGVLLDRLIEKMNTYSETRRQL